MDDAILNLCSNGYEVATVIFAMGAAVAVIMWGISTWFKD